MTHRTRAAAVLAAAALVTGACASETEPTAAVKSQPTVTYGHEKNQSGQQADRQLTTTQFMAGLRMTLPGTGWKIAGDSFLDLTLVPAGHPGSVLRAGKTMFAVTPKDEYLSKTNTPAATVRALQANPVLVVSKVRPVRAGDGLRGLAADVSLARGGSKGSTDFLAYKGTGMSSVALPGGAKARVYTFGIRQAFGPDSLTVVAVAKNPRDFTAWTKLAEQALATLHLPGGVEAAG